MNNNTEIDWVEFEEEDKEEQVIGEYDITSTPNDFNIKTIFDFIESGVVNIPGFQRNYVWDIKRASKLIESIIVGLPIPQVFLYEESRNRFLVIDGQQRLMSVFYFMKQRFPKFEKRVELRNIVDKEGSIPDAVLHSDEFFTKFNLSLPSPVAHAANKFHGLNYQTLGEYKFQFDLRPIRNVIIKQNSASPEDNAIYEIFNRLNSGGVNLTPHEIRASLYHSKFYGLLDRLNLNPKWRELVGAKEPDLNRKDVEIILRSFALLIDGDEYKPSMTKFLNGFSKKSKSMTDLNINFCESLFIDFIEACSGLEEKPFHNSRNKFNISTFDSVFVALCKSSYLKKQLNIGFLTMDKINLLKNDPVFINATQESTASSDNVRARIERASAILNG